MPRTNAVGAPRIRKVLVQERANGIPGGTTAGGHKVVRRRMPARRTEKHVGLIGFGGRFRPLKLLVL